MSAAGRDAVGRKHQALRTELIASGELLGGAGLADTRTMRLVDGAVAAAAGPLVAAREQLTAYYLVDCRDLDRALSIAERILDFHVTAIEVRQVHDSVNIAEHG